MTLGVVMVVTLSGLGCNNGASETPAIAPTSYASPQAGAATHIHATTASAQQHHHHHPGDAGGHSHGNGFADGDLGSQVHSTLYSFIFGHDPDVPTVIEIESRLASGEYDTATTDAYRH